MFQDCGIGSDPNATGPCTGTYGGAQQASQAGAHVYDGVHTSGVIAALLAAAVMVAGLGFCVLMVRKVGRFFGGGSDSHADAEFSDDALSDRDDGPTAEWSFEPDEFSGATRSSGADARFADEDAEDDSEQDGEISDEEFEAMDRERVRREADA